MQRLKKEFKRDWFKIPFDFRPFIKIYFYLYNSKYKYINNHENDVFMLFNYRKTTLSLKKKEKIYICFFDRHQPQRHEETISSNLTCCPFLDC